MLFILLCGDFFFLSIFGDCDHVCGGFLCVRVCVCGCFEKENLLETIFMGILLQRPVCCASHCRRCTHTQSSFLTPIRNKMKGLKKIKKRIGLGEFISVYFWGVASREGWEVSVYDDGVSKW